MTELDDLFDSLDVAVERVAEMPETDSRFSIMRDYIDNLSEFLEFTYAQKVQRLKARIRSETNDETQVELGGELYQIEEQGIENLSHTIWGGLLTTIFAAYESSIEELFAFLADKMSLPKFKRKRAMSFIEAAQDYSRKHLNSSLFGKPGERRLLTDLSRLRNSYVHNGCSLDGLPDIRQLECLV